MWSVKDYTHSSFFHILIFLSKEHDNSILLGFGSCNQVKYVTISACPSITLSKFLFVKSHNYIVFSSVVNAKLFPISSNAILNILNSYDGSSKAF